jgi:hypothetical protein
MPVRPYARMPVCRYAHTLVRLYAHTLVRRYAGMPVRPYARIRSHIPFPCSPAIYAHSSLVRLYAHTLVRPASKPVNVISNIQISYFYFEILYFSTLPSYLYHTYFVFNHVYFGEPSLAFALLNICDGFVYSLSR